MKRTQSKTKKAMKWSTVGAVLGGLVAVAGLVKAGHELWKYLHPQVLESRFVELKGDCLYRFIKNNAKPEDEFGIAKPVFADSIGLLNQLRDSLSKDLESGSSTESAAFLSLRNISGEQAERIVVHSQAPDASLTRIGSDETVLICVSIKRRGTNAETFSVHDAEFIAASGLNHSIHIGEIPPESQMVQKGSRGCVKLGYPPK